MYDAIHLCGNGDNGELVYLRRLQCTMTAIEPLSVCEGGEDTEQKRKRKREYQYSLHYEIRSS